MKLQYNTQLNLQPNKRVGQGGFAGGIRQCGKYFKFLITI